MGIFFCYPKRISLSICTSWIEIAEKTLIIDDIVFKQLLALNSKKDEDITPTDKDIIAFYSSFIPWDSSKVEGKKFDPEIARLADIAYSHIDGDKGSKEKIQMENDFVNLLKAIDELPNEVHAHHH